MLLLNLPRSSLRFKKCLGIAVAYNLTDAKNFEGNFWGAVVALEQLGSLERAPCTVQGVARLFVCCIYVGHSGAASNVIHLHLDLHSEYLRSLWIAACGREDRRQENLGAVNYVMTPLSDRCPPVTAPCANHAVCLRVAQMVCSMCHARRFQGV